MAFTPSSNLVTLSIYSSTCESPFHTNHAARLWHSLFSHPALQLGTTLSSPFALVACQTPNSQSSLTHSKWATIDYLHDKQAWLERDSLLTAKMLVGCVIQDLYMSCLVGLAWSQGTRLDGLDVEVEWHYRNSNLHRVYDWLDYSRRAAYHVVMLSYVCLCSIPYRKSTEQSFGCGRAGIPNIS